jgi:hypothetical protein
VLWSCACIRPSFRPSPSHKVPQLTVCFPILSVRACREHNIARSVLYEGTNIRLRRLLAKLRRGEPIVVAVVGGSVSAGQGLNFDNNAIV